MIWIQKLYRKTRLFGELVMFSHTLFSLPFALISMVWAAGGLPSAHVVLWSLIALVGRGTARTPSIGWPTGNTTRRTRGRPTAISRSGCFRSGK